MADDQNVETGDISDVTNTTAFLFIDNLVEEGKLAEERGMLFKAKFRELHDRVLKIHSNDNFLLKRARQLRRELDAEKAEVEKCGEKATTDDSTIQTLKKQLTEKEHDLATAQEKESMFQVEALELDRRRQTLTHDVEESIAAEEARLKPIIDGHDADIKKLGQEIHDTAAEFDALKAKREQLEAKENSLKDDIEKLNNDIYQAKMDFARIEKEPDRAEKQAKIVVQAVATAQKELGNINEKLRANEKLCNDLKKKRDDLKIQFDEASNALDADKQQVAHRQRLLAGLTATLEIDKGEYKKLQERLADLESLIKATRVAINSERDNLQRTMRDKEEGMKNFKKLEQQKEDLHHEAEIYRKQTEMLKREEQQLRQTQKQYKADLQELQRDVDILINNFLKEEITEKRCVNDKEAMVKLIRDLEDQVAKLAATEQRDQREASKLGLKRDQASREASRNQAKVQLATSEYKVKEVVRLELSKRCDDLNHRLKEAMEKYSAVKRERSTKSQMIQSASQTMSETTEKIKILENELEVLRRESLIKDQELKKREREAHEHRQSCKNLLVERNKWNKKLDAASHKQRDLRQQMTKLNSIITCTEDEMLGLKKAYEDAVENRNLTGIQLIDRNDELCILYEKANIQENILKRGMVSLNQREDEIRSTAIELADLQREIDLCQKVLPQVRDLEEDLAEMMLKLNEERWRAETLENDMTDQTRWRRVDKIGSKKNTAKSTGDAANGSVSGGTGDAPAADGDARNASEDFVELNEKHQKLEERLANVNERLMEKDLILEETTELCNRLRKQALNGRDFTLALANKVNGYQSGIKAKTKRMMATLSELSMVQASSIKLEHDVRTAEEQLEEARQRASRGLAPTEEVAIKFHKDLANEERRKQVLQERKQRMEQAANAPPVRSNAEQRPNAYVADDDLGRPKPYGANPPFKPTLIAQANAARFCKKTSTRELDLDE